MHVPSDDELAAIAVAYAAVVARRDEDGSQPPRGSRWALAGRLPLEHDTARVVASSSSRWSVAGRLSG